MQEKKKRYINNFKIETKVKYLVFSETYCLIC